MNSILNEKIEIVSEIYPFVHPDIQKDLFNKYINNYHTINYGETTDDMIVHIEPNNLFFEEKDSYHINTFICLDVRKYENIYKLYKYGGYNHIFYITFDLVSKKYYMIFPNNKSDYNDDDLMNNTIDFETYDWREIFIHTINYSMEIFPLLPTTSIPV